MKPLFSSLLFTVLAAVPLGAPAAAPIDDWLAAVSTHEQVVVAPRLDAIIGPMGRLVTRARRNPALAASLSGLVGDLAESLGFDPLDPAALKQAGIDLTGPVLLAEKGGAEVLVIAVKSAAYADALVRSAVEAQAIHVDGQPGWRWTGGVAVFARGALYVAADDAMLAALRRPAAAPKSPTTCPRSPGEADLFVFVRGLRTGCFTLRVDPDRIRLDGRLEDAASRPSDWLGRGAGLPGDIADPSLALALTPGPTLSAALSAGLMPENQPFVGPIAFGVGADLTDAVFRLTSSASGLDARLVERIAARTDLVVDAPVDGIRRIGLADPKPDPSMPLTEAWFGMRGGQLWVTTRAGAIGQSSGKAPRTSLSPDLFTNAGLVVLVRPAGAPHDGSRWVDAIAPQLRALDLDPAALRDVARALAFAWAHLGDVGIAVGAEVRSWRIAAEVIVL